MLAANGKDALTLIENEGRSEITADVPIILLTSDTNKEDILKGVDIGANDFVLKPFKFADLNKKIEKHL